MAADVLSTLPLHVDAGLLDARLPTRWHVLTGAACTGKTTLIEMLAGRGFAVVPESARICFERELAAGRALADIRRDGAHLQRSIAALQRSLEDAADPVRTTFLDRALPDSLTFFRVYGLDPHEVLPQCLRHRYASVLILDRLPQHRALALGPEDDRSSAFLDEWLVRDYRALGYHAVRIPVAPVEERLQLLLAALAGTGDATGRARDSAR